MPEPNASTPSHPVYGKIPSMGTMGILVRGGHEDKRVLLIHRRLKNAETRENGPADTWSFPGGGVDEDETPEQAIVREFKEEVALNVRIVPIGDELVWGETDDRLPDKQWRCFIYIVEQIHPTQKPIVAEPHKHVGLKWMKWDELWDNIKKSSEAKETSEGMRFFQTLHNMTEKYPKRADPASLERRIVV